MVNLSCEILKQVQDDLPGAYKTKKSLAKGK